MLLLFRYRRSIFDDTLSRFGSEGHKMRFLQTTLALSVVALAAMYARPAWSAPAPPDDIHVDATKTMQIPGLGVTYSGIVRVSASPGTHITVQNTSSGLRLTRETPGDNFVGNVVFDSSTESVDITADGVSFRDSKGHVLTIEYALRPAAMAANQAPPSAQPADSDPPSQPRPRRVDPVTDRGFVIP
jgi:hypothetical protein